MKLWIIEVMWPIDHGYKRRRRCWEPDISGYAAMRIFRNEKAAPEMIGLLRTLYPTGTKLRARSWAPMRRKAARRIK